MDELNEKSFELIQQFLPKYLSPELTKNLYNDIKDNFPKSTNQFIMYRELDQNVLFQGDIICDIPFADFLEGKFETSYMNGLIVSNTCDISLDNDRMTVPNIQFSKVVSLESYLGLLRSKNIQEARIETFVGNLKGNRITNAFYLPERIINGEVVLQESILLFDSNVSLPIGSILESGVYDISYATKGDRLVSFSNYGFYLLLIKLSIHYSRIREGVFRDS